MRRICVYSSAIYLCMGWSSWKDGYVGRIVLRYLCDIISHGAVRFSIARCLASTMRAIIGEGVRLVAHVGFWSNARLPFTEIQNPGG